MLVDQTLTTPSLTFAPRYSKSPHEIDHEDLGVYSYMVTWIWSLLSLQQTRSFNLPSVSFASQGTRGHRYYGSTNSLIRPTDGFSLLRVSTSPWSPRNTNLASLFHSNKSPDNEDGDNENEDEEKSHDNQKDHQNSNPYADPNYPDLEFMDYSNPDYQVDMGDDEEYRYSPDTTEERKL